MSQKPKKPQRRMCAYCREIHHFSKLTEDHIPPRNLYGKEWRKGKTLPFVDCCKSCQQGQSKGDEALMVMVAAGAVRSPHIAHLRPTFDRALAKPSWWRKQLVQAMEHATPIKVMGNIDAERLPMPSAFGEEVATSIRRIAIAVIFGIDPEWDSKRFDYYVISRNEGDMERVAASLRMMTGFRWSYTVGQEFFEARWDFIDSGESGLMHLVFFEALHFYVFISTHGNSGFPPALPKFNPAPSWLDRK